MIPLLALSFLAGAGKSYAGIKKAEATAERDKKAKEAERLYEEQTKALEHERQMDAKRFESILRIKEKEAEEAAKSGVSLKQGQNFRRLISAEPNLPFGEIAEATGYEGYDPEAVFSARAPIFDADGKQQYYKDNTPQMSLLQISLTKRDDPNAAITQFMGKVSPQTLEWWQKNNSGRYDQAVSFLTNNVAQLSKDAGTRGIQGLTQDSPYVPHATVQSLINAYGPKLTEKIIGDAMPIIGEHVRTFYEKLNWNVATDAKITPTVKEDITTGEKVIVPVVEDGGIHIQGVDNTNGTVNRKAVDTLKPITKVVGKDVSKLKSNIAIYAKATERTGNEVITSIDKTRKVLAGSDWWLMPTNEAGLLDASDKVAFGTFVSENGLYSDLSMTESLEMTEMLAGPGVSGFSYNYNQQDGIIPAHKGGTTAQFIQDEPGSFEKKLEAEAGRVETKYGYKVADIKNKSQAAKDAMNSVDALIYEYQYGESVPGLAGSFVEGIVGAKAQVSYFIQAVTSADMEESDRQEHLEKLRGLESKLNIEGLDRIAVSNRVREYYEGILVYAMAMALQGGNAAARTISDADIERIGNILSTTKTLATTEQKIAVMNALKIELERRSAIADFYASGKESKAWAAMTTENYLAENQYGGQTVVDALYSKYGDGTLGPARRTSQVTTDGPLIIMDPNGNPLYRQKNGRLARTKDPAMNYDTNSTQPTN